ncbi:hypothetical protein DCAR_0208686 [Daucus carota subsp. sativus]|uniref:Pentacotripeptide-repeat region of PRORP domain-containing protein n=2 Tax=Daucus carota subsp. sativus TaxID=79200 RepID=A0A166EQQ7_DAUCS|nr:hypothetical protein DCAR_0208686 [Daucus carota subsp. sativus]
MSLISHPLKPCNNQIFFITSRLLHSSKPTSILSQNRVEKLISSQSDPLLAKEIFDLASIQPNFHPSYSTFHSLILKLAHTRHFSHVNSLLAQLKSRNYPISPSLFSRLIRVYGETNHPEKALKMFHTILEFNTKPLPRHLNAILRVLVARRGFLRPALDLFRSAHRYGVLANVESYNVLMSAFCLNGDLSIAYKLFNEMFKRDLVPDVESYRIVMQGLCRRSQVSKAADLLEDMLNKGFVPDALSYTTLLNSLCRKKKLREAYKLLCRMKVKGCNPDIVHYNTLIFGFCRENKAVHAIKVLEDMYRNGCLPNLVSYRTLVGGLCNQGLYDDANKYTKEMIRKGFSPHFSVFHVLIKGLCNVGKIEEACELLVEMLKFGEAPHVDTWAEIVAQICDAEDEVLRVEDTLKKLLKVEIKPHTKIVEAGAGLEEYMNRKIQTRRKKF